MVGEMFLFSRDAFPDWVDDFIGQCSRIATLSYDTPIT